MIGKLIVIDGLDSSGKQTQAELLENRLKSEGHNVLKIQFPDYNDTSSALVKMYLNGDFGQKPDDVNAYAASTFYAVDRYASYKRYWQKFYSEGGIIIADRYTTSNAIHQAVKLDKDKRKDFFSWLYDFEFNLLGLPKPDCVVFLDVLPGISIKLMENRLNKIDNQKDKDIHEKNKSYIYDCYDCALLAAEVLGWVKIDCSENTLIKKIEDIHLEVYKVVINQVKKSN